MFTRRLFIGTAISAGVTSGAIAMADARAHAQASTSSAAPARIQLALSDSRFAAARVFGRAMGSRGVPVASFEGDVTAIWYHRLDPTWRERPFIVAGLTTESVLFCLEQLAWDRGLRVAYRGDHQVCASGGVKHVLETSSTRPQYVNTRLSGLTPWPAQVAEWITSIDDPHPAFPSAASARSRAEFTTRWRLGADADTRLISWLIAPKRPAASADVHS